MDNIYQKENTAVFIGHGECFGITSQEVESAIIELIKCGVTIFMSGGQGGFDRLCAGCVYNLKKQYPDLNNCLVICNAKKDDIYEAILKYNKNRVDCCTLLKLKIKDTIENPLKGLHDVLFLSAHKKEDDSEAIKKKLPQGYVNINDFSLQASLNPTVIDDLIKDATNRNYII